MRGKSPDKLKAMIRSAEGDITIVANPAAPAVFTATAIAIPTGQAVKSGAPGRAPPGGNWGTLKYVGSTTKMYACGLCLCCGPFGCCIMLCPVDEMDAYSAGGKYMTLQERTSAVRMRNSSPRGRPCIARTALSLFVRKRLMNGFKYSIPVILIYHVNCYTKLCG